MILGLYHNVVALSPSKGWWERAGNAGIFSASSFCTCRHLLPSLPSPSPGQTVPGLLSTTKKSLQRARAKPGASSHQLQHWLSCSAYLKGHFPCGSVLELESPFKKGNLEALPPAKELGETANAQHCTHKEEAGSKVGYQLQDRLI